MTPVASLYGSSPRISSPPKEKFSSNGGRKPVGFSLFHFYCHPLVRFLPWKGKIGRRKEETVEPGIVPHYRWRDRGGESRSTCVGIPRKRRRSCSLMDTNLDERARISIGASSFFLLSSAIERECITFTRRGRELYFSSSESNTRDDKRKNACATFFRRRKYIIRKSYGRSVKKATLESFSLRHVTYAPVWKGTYDKRKRQGEGVNARHSRGSIVACCCCDEGRIYRPFSASSLVNLCPTRKEEPSAPSGATMQPIFGPPFSFPFPLIDRRATPRDATCARPDPQIADLSILV